MIDRLTSARAAGRAIGLAAAVAVGALALLGLPAHAADVTLSETGSTLVYPLFKVWVSEYTKTHPGVVITTGGTGSAAGIAQAIAGSVQIGTSDAYMSDAEARRHPQIVNVPLAISAQTVNYNVPGLNTTGLKLDGPTLAGIFTGKIRNWDDKAIAALNPKVTLPHHDIIPVHRADGSGDTFVFTQYLTFSTPSWEDSLGFGTSIKWPAVPGGLSADGNDGVLQLVQKTPYAITYIGISFHADIEKAALGTALMKGYSGAFLLPTPETIAAAAASLGPRTPADERLTLVNAPGANAYPLVNYEYAVVSTKQANPAAAAAIRNFLLWAIRAERGERKISRRRPFHRSARPHMGAEPRPDHGDKIARAVACLGAAAPGRLLRRKNRSCPRRQRFWLSVDRQRAGQLCPAGKGTPSWVAGGRKMSSCRLRKQNDFRCLEERSVARVTETKLESAIEAAFERRAEITPETKGEVREAVSEALRLLDSGKLRVAERVAGAKGPQAWVVNQWLKKAVLLSFRLNDMAVIPGGPGQSSWWDKVPSKFEGWGAAEHAAAGFRSVPNCVVRHSAYIAPGVILMPSFVNLGAYVDTGTMVDTWATVGSCAQIGKNVHLSGGVGIGGVLEPLQANPTIIEDDCFIGARSEVVEGVVIGQGAVLAMGTFISASTKIIDRATGETHVGYVPPYSVVVSGNMPGRPLPDGTPGPSLYCAVIVKTVDAQTRSKTGINDLLRL